MSASIRTRPESSSACSHSVGEYVANRVPSLAEVSDANGWGACKSHIRPFAVSEQMEFDVAVGAVVAVPLQSVRLPLASACLSSAAPHPGGVIVQEIPICNSGIVHANPVEFQRVADVEVDDDPLSRPVARLVRRDDIEKGVGGDVGSLVGLLVGREVGMAVGLLVGFAVGWLVGGDDASAVGSNVSVSAVGGGVTGWSVGCDVGDAVGLDVGSSVGGAGEHSVQHWHSTRWQSAFNVSRLRVIVSAHTDGGMTPAISFP
eukprot:CAMPEP_0198121388 /NCGR_PEP_ID=MMETSP1442-20131203/31964_1 /TAXON_ID= /ORGANISM="Craspedostauros australis, Strain CCMP3328" /LENGTH=259 /DNA_ID=CAMNT_0043780181 /DNA_START=241 /DNA_END=1017 /DNA_ORIENTATION=+